MNTALSSTLNLNNVIIKRSIVQAEGAIFAKNIEAPALQSKKTIGLIHSEITHWVEAKGTVDVFKCKKIGEIFADGPVLIEQSTIEGSVSTLKTAQITSSKILGTLSCYNKNLTIKSSEINNIYLPSTKKNHEQVIKLIDTKVHSIIFEGRLKQITLSGSSKVTGEVKHLK